MTTERLDERPRLPRPVDRWRTVRIAGAVPRLETNQRQGRDGHCMTSTHARRAFDLSREPAAKSASATAGTLGDNRICWLGGWSRPACDFVTTVNGPSIIWDTHKDNFEQLKNRLVPPMEQAFAALLDDLAERGLLDSTLVVWMGDFGRTPIINKRRRPRPLAAVLLDGAGRRRHSRRPGDRPVGRRSARSASPVRLRRPTSMRRFSRPWATTRGP